MGDEGNKEVLSGLVRRAFHDGPQEIGLLLVILPGEIEVPVSFGERLREVLSLRPQG